jgi:hypothetical protein
MSEQSPYYDNSIRQTILLLNLLIVLATIISVVLIFLIITGYGKVDFSVPGNAVIKINGHSVKNGNIQMIPGNYQVTVSSPTIMPYQGTLIVGLFQSTIYKPRLVQRDAESIASSLLGGESQSGALQIGLVQWFDNNTWFAGLIGPNDAELAVHFDSAQNRWDVSYYNAGGYPEDLSKLPPTVAAYIEQLEAQNAQG